MSYANPFASVSPSFLLCAWTIFVGSQSVGVPGAGGQVFPTVAEGVKVRVDAPGLGIEKAPGVVREVSNGNLMIQFGQPRGTVAVPSSKIMTLEVSMGPGTRKTVGMLIGIVAGGIIGWNDSEYLPAQPGFDCRKHRPQGLLPCISRPARPEETVRKTVPYALLGGLAGFYIGRMFKTDEWIQVERNGADFSVNPTVGPISYGLTLSVSF